MGTVISEGPITRVNIGRLTNAIFAFTLLLLFKNVRIPSYADYVDTTTAHTFGMMQLSDIGSFLDAFFVIGMIWILVFHLFHQIRRVDRGYIYLHFILLMMVIFIPITSFLNDIYSDASIFSIFFHVNMGIIGVLLALEWHHCSGSHTMLMPDIPPGEKRCIRIKMLIIPISSIIGFWLFYNGYSINQDIYYLSMIAFPSVSWVCRIGQKKTRRRI